MIRHESMRGYFAFALHQAMQQNDNIWLLVGDLGYKVFDQHRADFPDRVINCGAAEQAMLDISVGLALEGRVPFVYSITPFLLYRPFETIRTYINHEQIPVKLIGSGRDYDYSHDGISHWSTDDRQVMALFPNIDSYWPEEKQELEHLVPHLVVKNTPSYINLRR